MQVNFIYIIAFLMIKKISKKLKTKKYLPVIAEEKSLQKDEIFQ